MDRIFIGENSIDAICGFMGSIMPGVNVLMVADSTPIYRGAENVKEKIYGLLSGRYMVKRLVLSGGGHDIRADEAASRLIQDSMGIADCVIGIGGGTITDLCKHAVYSSGKRVPLFIVQTVLSVNAFSDGVSVMLKQGVKRTAPTMFPTALAIDLALVRQAPFERTLSGFGDLMATWTAPADWFLSHKIGMNRNYHSAPYTILAKQNYELLVNAGKLKENDGKTFETLARVLTLSGLAMGIAGESSPASGTEHLMVHLLDMAAESKNSEIALHGAQVGAASLLASIAWDIFLDTFEPSNIDVDSCFPKEADMKKKVYQAFAALDAGGKAADECWNDYKKKLVTWRDNKDNFIRFLSAWPLFRKKVRTMVQKPEFLCECMQRAGAPTRFCQMGIDADTAKWAITNCHLFRNRFTLADMLFYTGWWNDDFINRITGRAHSMDAGL
ncbi:MAG: iron-containing alcohol dehydrogenase [Treponema sp.]|nr:iron-containing alcohol dehydrogenase [Treponema sp.]